MTVCRLRFTRKNPVSTVGQIERITQNRIVKLFQQHLGYTYLGNWETRANNRNIETDLLSQWLKQQGISDILINKALRQLDQAAALNEGQNLYDANKSVYRLLRYGVKTDARVLITTDRTELDEQIEKVLMDGRGNTITDPHLPIPRAKKRLL